jgi:DNA-binding MurR/RpiR family transcriptional regulator
MLMFDLNRLNSLEQEIYHTLIPHLKKGEHVKITQAGELCGCSSSKISKFVKKIGFDNYKQFVGFIQGERQKEKKASSEIERISNFVQEFDTAQVDTFIDQFEGHEKIVLFGYGPSFICAQYFEYKLRIHSDKFIVAVPDMLTASRLLDDKTLLAIFSTTGKFASFDEVCEQARRNGCDSILIAEEYNQDLIDNHKNILFLTNSNQSDILKPYEKSRTCSFIFIEEVVFKLIEKNRSAGS